MDKMLDSKSIYELFIDSHLDQITEIKEDLKHIKQNLLSDCDFKLDYIVEATKMKLISFFNLAHNHNVKSNLQDFDNRRREAFKKPLYRSLISLYANTYNQLLDDTFIKIGKIFNINLNNLKIILETPIKNYDKFSLKFIPPNLPEKIPTQQEIEDACGDLSYYTMKMPEELNLEKNQTYNLENALLLKFAIEDSIYMKYKLDERQLLYFADLYNIMVLNEQK